MEAGLTSRRKVVEATGYDIEEVDRENASDAKRAADLVLTYRASPGETQGARATPTGIPDPNIPTMTAASRPRHRRRSKLMKSRYTIRSRTSGTEVLIYDEIGAYGVTAKGLLAELGALPDDASIDLRLNSPGGSVFDDVAIYNALKRH